MAKIKHFKIEEKITLAGMTWTVVLSTETNNVLIQPNEFLDELSSEELKIFWN